MDNIFAHLFFAHFLTNISSIQGEYRLLPVPSDVIENHQFFVKYTFSRLSSVLFADQAVIIFFTGIFYLGYTNAHE